MLFRGLTKYDQSILIGNALDHFNSSLYGFLAPVLAPIFFPNHEPIVQLILTYSIMASSSITRPIGTFLFGALAKHYGPLLGLSYSLIGVAITTMCIGCIPNYHQIGYLAPIALIALRMIRGIFSSGESTIARLYIMEGKIPKQALNASYLYQSSTMIGIIIASGIATLVTLHSSIDILWRISFWLGGLTGLVGCWLRQQPMHKVTKKNKEEIIFKLYQISSLKSLWVGKKNVFRVIMTTALSYITYDLPFVFMISFIPLVTNISLQTMLVLNTTLLVLDMLLIPLIGQWMLRFDPKKSLIFSSVFFAVTIIPIFSGLEDASLAYVTFVRFWIVVLGVMFLCPLNYWFKNLFISEEKYLLIGMGHAGGSTLGRFTTAICLFLWQATTSVLFPACYVAIIASLTAYAVKTSRSQSEKEPVFKTAPQPLS